MDERHADMRIGCAGWSLPRAAWPHFPAEGTHLARYAARFNAVEINSSFYRPHRPDTYRRWAESVPPAFRFSVKLPRAITHEHRLVDTGALLARFLGEVGELGDRLGVLLVQLPPSLAFDEAVARAFIHELCDGFAGNVVWEPRHASWFGAPATELLAAARIARVAADPAPVPAAAEPGAWPGLVYYRLHGSPRMYYSPYAPAQLQILAAELERQRRAGRDTWCIFDNTAEGAALTDALLLQRLLAGAQA